MNTFSSFHVFLVLKSKLEAGSWKTLYIDIGFYQLTSVLYSRRGSWKAGVEDDFQVLVSG